MKRLFSVLLFALACALPAFAQDIGRFGSATTGIRGVSLENRSGYVYVKNDSGRTILAINYRAETDNGDATTITAYLLHRPLETGAERMLLPIHDMTHGGRKLSTLAVDSAVSDAGEFWGPDRQHQFPRMRDAFRRFNAIARGESTPAESEGFFERQVRGDLDNLKKLKRVPELHSVNLAQQTYFGPTNPWDFYWFYGSVYPQGGYSKPWITPNVGAYAICYYPGGSIATIQMQFSMYSCPINPTYFNMQVYTYHLTIGGVPNAYNLMENDGQGSIITATNGSVPIWSWTQTDTCDTGLTFTYWEYDGCPNYPVA